MERLTTVAGRGFRCGLVVAAVLALGVVAGTAQTVSIAALGTPYTQDFNTLASSGTSSVTPNGWAFSESGSNANGTYAAGNGSSNTGNTYSFGATGSSERAFGGLQSGSLIPTIGAAFSNDTGATISELLISYTGEQWRLGTSGRGADRLEFQLSTDATSLTTGTWVSHTALNFSSPVTVGTVGALDGNAGANRTVVSGTITGLAIPPGQTFWIRWNDYNVSGSDDGLAVDDFSITANGGVGVFLSIDDVTVTEGDSGTTAAVFTVSLSGPALPGGVTFDIATADGSATVADNDYQPLLLTGQTIPEGSQTAAFTVLVNGDTTIEPDETFTVNVSNVAGATVSDAQGLGTIVSDDFLMTPIHDIQGPGTVSPLAGQAVVTRGIVTAVKSNGFFLQAPENAYDGDPNSSEGIFVFTASAPPAAAAVGNDVKVTGTVSEYVPSADPYSPPMTELSGTVTVLALSGGNPLPAPVTLTADDVSPSGSIEQLERFEGMLVSADLTVVGPTEGSINAADEVNGTATSNGVFYGVVSGVARPFREAGIEAPDPIPTPPCCIPRFDGNPERLRVDSDGLIGAARIEVTAGATVTGLVGPLDYAYRTYTILPLPGSSPVVGGNVGPTAVRPAADDEVTVGTANLLRFYDDVDDPAIQEPVLTPAAFAGRVAKASLAIRGLMGSPDILGVQEVENLSTLQTLAAKLNADAIAAGDPDPGYQAYLEEGNDVGGIDVGFLVKASRVDVVSVVQVGKDTIFPFDGSLLNDRPPLVLEAVLHPTVGPSLPLSVIVVHQRSLSGVNDPTDGERVREKRKAQAEFLASLVQSRQTADPMERIVVVGDFNAYQFNDGYVDVVGTVEGTPTSPDEVLLASSDLVDPNLVDLMGTLSAGERYSYVYDGSAQTLDQTLVSGNAMPQVRGFQIARMNSDFPVSFHGDFGRPERVSDHDGEVAFLTAAADLGLTMTASAESVLPGGTFSYTAAVTNAGPSDAASLSFTDALPAGTGFVSAGGGGWSCNETGGTVTCTLAALAAGGNTSFTVTVTAPTAPQILTNTATVGAATVDPDEANNQAGCEIIVAPAGTSVVDGYVLDAGHNYPLLARVAVSHNGTPAATTFTDPFSGYFEVTLGNGGRYDFVASAEYPGYAPANRQIVVVASDQSATFVLAPDGSCTAAGYRMASGCAALFGGLVAGFVNDGNTGSPVVGATVANDLGGLATAIATPTYPNIGDGFYVLFTPIPPLEGPSTRTFTASKDGYGNDVKRLNIVPNAVTRVDFALPAGVLQWSPDRLTSRLYPAQTEEQALTLSNLGGLTAAFQAFPLAQTATWNHQWPNHDPVPSPRVAGDAARRPIASLKGVPVNAGSRAPAPPLAAGGVVGSWPSGLGTPWGVGAVQTGDTLWVSSLGASMGGTGDIKDHEFGADGTSTGGVVDFSGFYYQYGADMAFDSRHGTVWQMNVNIGDPQEIDEFDPASHSWTGNVIQVHGLSSWRTGLAYDPVSDTFFMGGWNDGMVVRFDRTGAVLETKAINLSIAGLAYNPSSGHLFVQENSTSDAVTVLDVNDDYSVVGSFTVAGFGGYAGAGIDFDCNGHLWAVNQNDGKVYEVASGETGTCWFPPLGWLTLTPASGTVAPASAAPVTAHFDADGAPHFGLFRAEILTVHDTPYGVARVLVCFTRAFLDVPAGYWADAFIHAVAGAGITDGCGAGNFCPDGAMVRGTMARWLLLGRHGASYVPPPCTGIFADVDCETTPNADFIEELYREGITAGCNTDPLMYCPDVPVTRAQMAVFLLKAKEAQGYLPPPCTGLFDDVACPGGFAVNWIEELYRRGITAGCGTRVFCPDVTTTHAQEAVFVKKDWSIPTCQ